MAAIEITASPLVRTYSLEEFWELPDPSDGSKLELIAGVLYVAPPPAHLHDAIVSRLNRELVVHCATQGQGGAVISPALPSG